MKPTKGCGKEERASANLLYDCGGDDSDNELQATVNRPSRIYSMCW